MDVWDGECGYEKWSSIGIEGVGGKGCEEGWIDNGGRRC